MFRESFFCVPVEEAFRRKVEGAFRRKTGSADEWETGVFWVECLLHIFENV